MARSTAWQEHSFDVDDAFVDETQLVFVAPSATGTPRYTLTVTREASAPEGVKGYVDGVLRELVTAVPGFRLHDRDDRATLNGRPGIRVVYAAMTPQAQDLLQLQGFGDDGAGGIIIVTCTTHPSEEGAARAAFNTVWSSWKRR